MWKSGKILYTCRVSRLPCAIAEGQLVVDHCCALLEALQYLFFLLVFTKILFNLETSFKLAVV